MFFCLLFKKIIKYSSVNLRDYVSRPYKSVENLVTLYSLLFRTHSSRHFNLRVCSGTER